MTNSLVDKVAIVTGAGRGTTFYFEHLGNSVRLGRGHGQASLAA